jgi:gliding motility-associated-like protein
MNKLILSFIMSFCLASTLWAHNGEITGGEASMEGLQLTIESKSVQPNEEFCLSVSVEGFTNLIGMQFSINYDPAALDFVSVGNFNLSGLTAGAFGTPANGTSPGVITLAWVEPALNATSVDDGVAIFDLCFKAKDASTSDVDFSSTPTSIEFTDGNEQPVMFTGVKGQVVVGDGGSSGGGGNNGGGSNTTDFTLSLVDQTVNPGEEICIPVTVQNFNDIIGMQFSINYDPSILEFSSVGSLNLSGLTEGAFGTPVNGTAPGIITLAWVEPALSPVTLDDGSVIFEVCFMPRVSSGTTNVVFSGNPTSIEVTNGNEENVPFVGEDAEVIIGDGEGSGFRLAIADATVRPGSSVCLPVTVRDFIDIIGMQFSINYDPAQLQFDGVSGFNLSGLTEGAFGTPANGTDPGVVTMVWVEPALTPITLNNNDTIFEICFTTLGADGSETDVVFSNNPTNIEITDGNEQGVPFMGSNGTITIDDNVVSEDALVLTVSDTTVATGSNFCVDVTGVKFTDIVGMQFTIEYDPAALEFTEVNNFGVSGMNESQFATPSPGKITLAWVDPTIEGVTIPDSSTLFSLCFRALANSGSSEIIFTDTPTDIEVTKKEGSSEVMTDFAGMPGTISFLDTPPPNILLPAAITDAVCAENNNPGGAIDIEVENGSGNYTYAWDYQDATTQDLNNIPAGTYSVTVTDTESGLTDTETFTVNGPDAPIVVGSLDVTNVNCFGAASGAIDVMASGGVGQLTYTWNQGLPETSSQSGLTAGLGYSFTITDESGCSFQSEVIILDEPGDLEMMATTTDIQCEGDTDGSISISLSGASPEYNIDWPGELPDNQLSQTGLTNGVYSITITDANNCEFIREAEVGVISPLSLSNVDITDISNETAGSLDITVAGGSNNLSFNWSGPNGFTSESEDLFGLTATGEYCLTIIDNDGGCSIERCIGIYNAMRFNESEVTNSCATDPTGSVILNISGGEQPYLYEWSNGAGTKDLMGVAEGTYSVTVVDNRGLSIERSFNVGAFDPLTLSANVIPVTSNPDNTNGTINLIVSGGLPEYTFEWDNGRTTQVLAELGTGEYCVTVTDRTGCQVEDCINVEYVPTPLSVSPIFENISCSGQQDGSLSLAITGGLSPYIVTFSDGTMTTNNNGLVVKNNQGPGELNYIVEDGTGEQVNGSVVFTEPEPLIITDFEVLHDTEDPGCTGSIELAITGGTPNYMVQWNSPNMGANIINLCAGEFSPTVIDANGCIATLENPIVVTMFSVDAIVTNADCQDSANGQIDLEVAGGDNPYSYVWKNEVGQTISQEEDPADLAPGMYTVSITESSGNVLVRQIEVFASSSLDVEIDVQSNFNGFAVSCPDANDGAVSATAINGSGTYTYEWVRDDVMISMDANLTNAGPGIYELTAIDGNGCSITKQITLTSPPRVNLNASTRDVSCNGARDGEVVIIASGGGGSSFTYDWSNGAQGARVSFLPKGEFSVTVTDQNNCSVSGTYNIDEPEPLAVEVETTPANEGCNGTATAMVSGGTAPYTYVWNAGLSNEATQTNLCAGEYNVIVRDANGCSNDEAPALLSIKDRTFPCIESSVVITPDGDGLNEVFMINCIEELSNNTVQIYNRWGQLVYERDDYDNTWNGVTTNGDELPDGPYYYIIEWGPITERQQVKGSISVLRE